jgi:hypothetical protein
MLPWETFFWFQSDNFLTPTFSAAKGVRGDITPTLMTSGGDATDRSSGYTTASVTPVADELVVVLVGCAHASAAEVPSSVSGNGITYAAVPGTATQAFLSAGLRRVSAFYGFHSSPSAGAITIDFATTHTGCVWGVVRFPGARRSVAPRQATANLASSTTVTGTLAALENAKNVHIYGLLRSIAEASAPPASGGWTEIADQTVATPGQQLEIAWARNDTTADPTWVTSGATGIVSIEIQAA